MTIIEMHEKCDLKLDKANSPWYTSVEKDIYLNEAHLEFVKIRHERFELDEYVRKELLPLVRKSSGLNTNKINYDAIDDFMVTLNLKGVFNNVCGSGTTLRPISPLQLDDEGENELDPFNKSGNDNPLYTEENDGTNNVAIILSDDVPVSYVLKYLKIPKTVVNDVNNPSNNVNSEMPIFTHEDIVDIAVSKMLANTEQQLGYQLHQNEIINENK